MELGGKGGEDEDDGVWRRRRSASTAAQFLWPKALSDIACFPELQLYFIRAANDSVPKQQRTTLRPESHSAVLCFDQPNIIIRSTHSRSTSPDNRFATNRSAIPQ